MMQWLDVIGIGEDGYESLSIVAQAALNKAEVIIGGDRHHALTPQLRGTRVRWSRPYSQMIATVTAHRPQKTALLVTGDPLWYSAGAKLLNEIPLREITFHTQLSAFQLACARMGWSLADIETLTAHGRSMKQILPYIRPNARLIVLTSGSEAVHEAAKLLTQHQFGESQMTVLASLGGPHESKFKNKAYLWADEDPTAHIPSFHTLCIECEADQDAQILSQLPGLPDEVFETDGNNTKQHVRAMTVCMLAPHRGGLLWDIGTGCGTVAIEWMRAARDSQAIGIDFNQERLQLAKQNAINLGVPALQLIEGHAPNILADLPRPDAIFIGGGLSHELVSKVIVKLNPHGRLVANVVTVESEKILYETHAKYGGDLSRIGVARVKPLGAVSGWRQQMTVTQWRYQK